MLRSTIAPISGILAGLSVGFTVAIPAAKAQEPLLLRIRPVGEAPTVGGGTAASQEAVAQHARARAQAVWEHADRRARIAIASVCTGCLMPEHPARAPSLGSERVEAAGVVPPQYSFFAQTGAP